MLETRSLRKSFGALRVTDDVTLTLAHGERHAVIGPNGAGKTTLFNLITGDLRPDSGAVLLGSGDVTRYPPAARVRAGLARSFQRNNLFLDKTVRQSLAIAVVLQQRKSWIFWKPFRDMEAAHRRAVDLAADVGLEPHLDHLVRHLSYGSQRQLEIALALAVNPGVLLLDEPTAGMSPEETLDMQRLIAGLSRDLTILLIEHDMDVVFGLADRITVLHLGAIIAQGTPDAIRESQSVHEIYLGKDPGVG